VANYQQGVPIKISDTFRIAGTETDPTIVTWKILGPDGTVTTYQWPGSPEVTHVNVGVFFLSLTPPALPGFYSYDVDATGAVVASRAGSFTVLPNVAVDVDLDWAVPGPCAPWASSQDVWNCCGQPMVTIAGDTCPVDFSSEAYMASELLFELSGRLYAGACEKTVRPCGKQLCGLQILSRGHIIGGWDWGDFGWTGSWWGYGGTNACGCHPLDYVLLSGYPVREITEVKIDGVVVNPATYRLDDRRYLVRMRDPLDPDTPLFWPACQLMDLNDDQDGTFSVTYRYGQDPPVSGTRAAAALACQLHRACEGGGDCEIPANAVRVTRQGVTIDRNATIAWFYGKNDENGWQTGIPAVDAFLNAFNKAGMQQRPRTWSPDGHKYARAVGQ
jgi:hypothetical protein